MWLIYIFNLVDITKLPCYPHRRSTTVSLETFTILAIKIDCQISPNDHFFQFLLWNLLGFLMINNYGGEFKKVKKTQNDYYQIYCRTNGKWHA